MSATFSMSGRKGTLQIEVKDGSTITEVVEEALGFLKLPAGAAENLAVVKNGEDAKGTDPVRDGDVVTVAGQVANG